jgi:hypothetical protein
VGDRGDCVVVLEVGDETLAAKLSRDFCENYFNIPTCTHWDGRTLSLYCGDVSHVVVDGLKRRVRDWIGNSMGLLVR